MRNDDAPLEHKPILLATDGSPLAARARAVAVDLCARSGAPLHLVHVWGMPGSFRIVTQQSDDDLKAQLRRDAEELLARESAAARAGGVQVREGHLGHDVPAAAILAMAQQVDPAMVVIGSHGRGAVGRAFLGTVSERVVREAGHPVLVVRDGSVWPPRRIVVRDDGSPGADRAGVLAAQVARLLGVELLLVHAQRSPGGVEGVPGHTWLASRAAVLEAGQGCRVDSLVVDGDAGEALRRVALEPPSLVVVGASVRSAVAGERGSDATAALRGLRTLPLLVVPAAHRAWAPAAAPAAVEAGP